MKDIRTAAISNYAKKMGYSGNLNTLKDEAIAKYHERMIREAK